MFYQFDKAIFNLYSKSKKAKCVLEQGSFMGTRQFHGRTISLYMYKSLFLEVYFIDDNSNNEIETVSLIGNISGLNSHLEKQFKKDFRRPTFSQGLSA